MSAMASSYRMQNYMCSRCSPQLLASPALIPEPEYTRSLLNMIGGQA